MTQSLASSSLICGSYANVSPAETIACMNGQISGQSSSVASLTVKLVDSAIPRS